MSKDDIDRMVKEAEAHEVPEGDEALPVASVPSSWLSACFAFRTGF